MKEPVFNVGLVCKDHAPKPGKFAASDPTKLIGEMVKLGFPAKNPHTGVDTLEHMWVRVTGLLPKGMDGVELVGTLNNDPVLICEYQDGDRVAFGVEEIEDVYIDV